MGLCQLHPVLPWTQPLFARPDCFTENRYLWEPAKKLWCCREARTHGRTPQFDSEHFGFWSTRCCESCDAIGFFGLPEMPELELYTQPKNYRQFLKDYHGLISADPRGTRGGRAREERFLGPQKQCNNMQHVSPLFVPGLQEAVRTERSMEKCTKPGSCVKCQANDFSFLFFSRESVATLRVFFLVRRHSKGWKTHAKRMPVDALSVLILLWNHKRAFQQRWFIITHTLYIYICICN